MSMKKNTPEQGAAAFEKIKSRLTDLSPSALRQPRVDAYAAGQLGLRVAEALSTPGMRKPFDEIAGSSWNKRHLDDLETVSAALMFARTNAESESARQVDAKIPAALFQRASELKVRMTRVADYYLGMEPTLAAELASIREGTGYLDLAQDLHRLGKIYGDHKATLAHDTKWYSATDAADAAKLEAEIVQSFERWGSSMWGDLATRAYTLFEETYGEVRAAAEFVFRNDPAKLAMVPSMFVELRARARAKGEGQLPTPSPGPGPT